MKGTLSKAFVATLFVTFSLSALAVPIALTEGDFAGSATVVDFNAISNWQRLDNQYASVNVNFFGSLYGLSNPGDTSLFNGSTIASNWMYWPGTGSMGSSWEATFSHLITMVGFLAETNRADSVTIEAFAGAASRGSLNFLNPNGFTPDFLGLTDVSGFDKIVVTTANNHNGFFAMDDFRFDGSVSAVDNSLPPVAVAEPGTLALVALGLLGIGFARQRRFHVR